MNIHEYLKLMADEQASDLFLTTGTPVHIKIEGKLQEIGQYPLRPGETKTVAYSLMSENQKEQFEAEDELDFGLSLKKIGRYRINVFRQRGEVAMVIRYVTFAVPSVEDLHLPPVLKELAMAPRGLILVVGTTGSGKTTTLASMIDHRNSSIANHILTVEDPIEFIHPHKQSVVNQREVGVDTKSFTSALKRAMRESPDVILIGEIRDKETMEQAIAYAETGHLCLATLHATNGYQTLQRIINFFPESTHKQLYMDLALNLRSIISQRLVVGKNNKRLPAIEILLNTPYISELILTRQIDQIAEAMEHDKDCGMVTFDTSLYELQKAGLISEEEALYNADSRTNLSLKIRLDHSGPADIKDNLSFGG